MEKFTITILCNIECFLLPHSFSEELKLNEWDRVFSVFILYVASCGILLPIKNMEKFIFNIRRISG